MKWMVTQQLPAGVSHSEYGSLGQMMQDAKPEDPPTCYSTIAIHTRNMHLHPHLPTTKVELYQRASGRAGITSDAQHFPDRPALSLIHPFPEDQGSSKKTHRQVSKLRRTHHHGLSINKTLAQHRSNGSVIFITSDSSSPSIRIFQNFPERTRLRQWLSASCDHKLYTRPYNLHFRSHRLLPLARSQSHNSRSDTAHIHRWAHL